jgi:hypothetical protein
MCGAENTYSHATGAAFLTNKAWVNDCGYCHARWTDWQQAEIDRLKQELALANEAARTSTKCLQEEEADNDRLEQELADFKPKWETGTMPHEGWYWIKFDPSEPECVSPYCEYVSDMYLNMHLQWSGPIPQPEEEIA